MASDDGIILALVDTGDVHSEHDSNLSLDLAVEVLRAAPVQGSLCRFERKANVTVAMIHPNMAIIDALKITANNAVATSEEEAYEATPMGSLVTHSGSFDPS